MNYIVSEYVVPPEEVTLRAIVCPGTIVKLLIPTFTRLTVYVDVLIKKVPAVVVPETAVYTNGSKTVVVGGTIVREYI
jgi:hypothetical protein